jgi:hypothetical protein
VSSSLFTLIVFLVAVFLVIVAVMVWQEGTTRTMTGEPVYVVDDAVQFIDDRLTDTALGRADIRRIVEWEVYYLQGLAQKDRRTPVEVVAGGAEPAVEYIKGRIADTHGVAYSHHDIRRVLAIEADYLASIGAVGARVENDALGGDEQ